MPHSSCFLAILSLSVVSGLAALAPAHAQTAIEMQQLRQIISEDKKGVIEANLDLTSAQAAEFWPIYDEFQTEIQVLNNRVGWLIRDYGAAYEAGNVTEEQAGELVDELLDIDSDDASLRKKYARQFSKVLPPDMLIRYLQMENKIHAVVRFDLAANITLFE